MAKKKTETREAESGAEAFGSTRSRYEAKARAAFAALPSVDDFRRDPAVDRVFKTSHRVVEAGLDRLPPDVLLRLGGQLVGDYGYLSQRSAEARAERDVYEQQLEDIEKSIILEALNSVNGYKVTEARAYAREQLVESRTLLQEKELMKNRWESVVEACGRLAIFIQSAIKVKEGERGASSRILNQS